MTNQKFISQLAEKDFLKVAWQRKRNRMIQHIAGISFLVVVWFFVAFISVARCESVLRAGAIHC